MSKYTTLVLDEEQKEKLVRVLTSTIALCNDVINEADGINNYTPAESIDPASLHNEAQELLEDIQA